MTPRFSVIIPAHNEERRIEATLHSYAGAFPDSEIVVVLNGCTDGTKACVQRAQQNHANIEYVEIDHAVGKGGAVRAGFLVARSPVVGFADADCATPPAEMRRLFESLGDDDGVIGSRWMRGAKVFNAQPFRRRVASRVFNALVRTFFGLRFHDTQCGAKVFRANVLQRVITHVETANMAFDVDLLVSLKQAGYRVVEQPTEWRDVHGSSVQLLGTSARMLAALVRLRLHRSFLRIILPLFDRFFPTLPIKAHDGLRILVLNWRDPRNPQAGGAEAYLFEMAKHWTTWGNSVEWLTAGFKGAPRHETIDGIEVTRVGNKFTVYGLVPFAYLNRFRDRFDVIVDSENGIPFFSPLFSMKPKVCVMHHVHQRVFRAHLPFPFSEAFAWAERRLMPLVYANTQFVAVSNDTRAEMQSYDMSRLPIDVVHNGVDPALAPGPKSDRPTVLYFGRLKPYKRVERLIDCFARVRAAVPDAVLRVAGAGESEVELCRRAVERGLEASVIFEGYVSDERKRVLLQEAWVLANPSSMEGWGISIIEANACGTPAVAYRVPGLREAIRDGVTGMLVDDDADLAVPIVRLLDDDAMRGHLSENALKHAAAHSWHESAERFFDVMLHVMAGESYSLVRSNGHWVVVRGRDVESGGADSALAKMPIAFANASARRVLVAPSAE